MRIVDSWSLFFESLETVKAKLLRSKARFILEIIGCVTGEYVCNRCNLSLLVPEQPGEFRDFDADPMFDSVGIPLCSKCLGTGKMMKSGQFKKLSEEVSEIRSESLSVQINEKKLPWSEVREKVKAINSRLTEISKEGLKLVKHPIKGCLALELAGE